MDDLWISLSARKL